MMPLHCRVKNSEVRDEPSRFSDFLKGAEKLVLRMDEVHPSENNDGHYLFLIWVSEDRDEEAREMIESNIKKSSHGSGWDSRVLPDTGAGLIIVSTWI